jgi:integrase
VCERAGISYSGAHMLRRSAATAAARSGASPAALAAFLGHRDLRQAQVYIGLLGDDGSRIAASLDGYGSEPRGKDTGNASDGSEEE